MTNRNKMLGGNKDKIINSKGKEFIHLIGEIGECILNRTTREDKEEYTCIMNLHTQNREIVR